MEDYDENTGSSYLPHWDINNLYRCAMSQNLLLGSFDWVEETSQFNKDFIKSSNDDSDVRYFLEADVQYLEKLHDL